MSEKKMVGRSIVVALGIIFVLLIVFISYLSIIDLLAQNSYNNLQNQNQQLQTWFDDNITHYNSQIGSLNSQISSLNSQIANLQSQYAGLQANYSQLMQEYQSALARIPADKGIAIDGINYTSGNTGYITGVAIRNLGVNPTTVTSLKLYWTNEGVLASSASVNVVISGNSTANIQTYLPINGWNTVYDTWVLKVYTLESYNVTSDPLMIIL